jgi:endonuclease-3 related protein
VPTDLSSAESAPSQKRRRSARYITRYETIRSETTPSQLPAYYTALLARYGPQNWWPAQSRFEVIVGAYLTQNTNWSNVEKALFNLRRARKLTISAMREAPIDELEALVRPSGYFRQKARNLKTFVAFLDRQYSGSLTRMFAQPTEKLRAELLELNGVGLETADSILLYAGNHPVFVVDAYTRRVLLRHGIINEKTGYEEIRAMIEHAISSSEAECLVAQNAVFDPRHPVSRMSSSARSALAQHYNELHALIVRVGNHYCRTKPICEGCPLQSFLKTADGATTQRAPESY